MDLLGFGFDVHVVVIFILFYTQSSKSVKSRVLGPVFASAPGMKFDVFLRRQYLISSFSLLLIFFFNCPGSVGRVFEPQDLTFLAYLCSIYLSCIK